MYFSGPSTSTASLTLCSAHANESTENIDEIVQDHDTFGTDENEEDSMDSLTMALMESRSAASNMASNSSYMSSLSANKIGGKKLICLKVNPPKFRFMESLCHTDILRYFEFLRQFSKKQNMSKKKYQLKRNEKVVDKAQQCNVLPF